jgi:hypothetical protein
MAITPVGIAFKIAYQLSPIFLSGSSSITGALTFSPVPFIMLTEGLGLNTLFSIPRQNIELDDFFAHFVPMPGSTLVDNQIATYPFANQAIAANAVIKQPLTISMRMICPVRNRLGYAAKIATMMLIKSSLETHNEQGGTYSVLTPSYFYTDCIMTRMSDISGGQSAQAQHTWQFDFVQPLLTQQAADQALNNLWSKFNNGGQITGSGTSGVNATQVLGPSTVPTLPLTDSLSSPAFIPPPGQGGIN